jgi:ABC-type dipeptide/oligopeptide/nickel transport system ATPase component
VIKDEPLTALGVRELAMVLELMKEALLRLRWTIAMVNKSETSNETVAGFMTGALAALA